MIGEQCSYIRVVPSILLPVFETNIREIEGSVSVPKASSPHMARERGRKSEIEILNLEAAGEGEGGKKFHLFFSNIKEKVSSARNKIGNCGESRKKERSRNNNIEMQFFCYAPCNNQSQRSVG